MIWWAWRCRKAAVTQVIGGRVAVGGNITVHAGEADPVVRLHEAAHEFMSRSELVWDVHASAEINGERGPGYFWEERALIQVDEALVRLRAEADRTRALLPDLALLVDSIVTEAHSARQFCIEDYVPEETTTSHFWQHLRILRTILTEFTRAAT